VPVAIHADRDRASSSGIGGCRPTLIEAGKPRSGVGESAPAKAGHFGQATEGTEMGTNRSPKAAICEQRLADTNINITIMYST